MYISPEKQLISAGKSNKSLQTPIQIVNLSPIGDFIAILLQNFQKIKIKFKKAV